MNCRPGDLAFVVHFPLARSLIGHPVQLANEPAFYIGSAAYWNLLTPVRVVYDCDCIDARGNDIAAGASLTIKAFADECLRPIRDPGEDAVDEVLQRVGAPNYGEVQHG